MQENIFPNNQKTTSAEPVLKPASQKNQNFNREKNFDINEAEQKQLELGNSLGVLFANNEVHPILLFGSQMSGKTSMIMSILNYPLRADDAHFSIDYDDSFFDGNARELFAEMISAGQLLYYRNAEDWVGGAAPAATLNENPFFIPIKITKRNGHVIKFAILEGRGEWYMPDDEAVNPHRPFKGMIKGFLQNFSKPITVLYIAPYVSGSYSEAANGENNNLRQRADTGLFGAIDQYIYNRRVEHSMDFNILVMTKWDVHCKRIDNPNFINPNNEEVLHQIKNKFPLAWNRFNNIPNSADESRSKISVYCSGFIDNGKIAPVADRSRSLLERYPRKFWDAFHKNAGYGILYKDVQPKKPSLIDWMISFLRG